MGNQSYFLRFSYWLADKIFPERMIRILFLSSLYSRLFKVEVLEDDIFHKVNEILSVCETDSALGVGMKLNRVFWDNVELGVIETQLIDGKIQIGKETKEKIIREIIAKTPSWLRYSKEEMQKDVGRLVDNRMRLQLSVA